MFKCMHSAHGRSPHQNVYSPHTHARTPTGTWATTWATHTDQSHRSAPAHIRTGTRTRLPTWTTARPQTPDPNHPCVHPFSWYPTKSATPPHRYQDAAADLDNRESRINDLANEIERGLELVGVTAIEDKLQASQSAHGSACVWMGARMRCRAVFVVSLKRNVPTCPKPTFLRRAAVAAGRQHRATLSHPKTNVSPCDNKD